MWIRFCKCTFNRNNANTKFLHPNACSRNFKNQQIFFPRILSNEFSQQYPAKMRYSRRNYNRSQRRKRVCILQNPNLKCIKTFWLKLSENERSKILQIDLNKLCKQMEKQRSSFFKLFKGIKNIQYLQILLECIKNL